jgi:hypothetical protein
VHCVLVGQEPIRNLCYFYSAHEDPAEEMRKLLPPPPFARPAKKLVDQRPIRAEKPHHRECRRQEGLLPDTTSSAENTFTPCLQPIDSVSIALCPSVAHPKIRRLSPSLRGRYEGYDKECF